MNTGTSNSALRWASSAVILAALTISLSAQVTPEAKPKPESSTANDTPLALDPFQVVSTQERGYNVTNSAMALRTNEEIMEVPQSVSVITRDMINDLASENTSDYVNYSGGANFFQGDSAMLRGVRASIYADGVVDYNFDPVTTDSVTIVRGPVGVLYGVGAVGNLGGAVLKNTRTPADKRLGSVTLRLDEFGFVRAELDYSDVIKRVGDTRFAFRFDAASQRGRFYWKDLKNDRDVAYLVMEMKRPSNNLRINYTWSRINSDPHRNFFVTPQGEVYNGWDRDEAYMPSWAKVTRRDDTVRILFNQRLSQNWNMALRGAYSRNYYEAPVVLTAVNWATNEVLYWSRLNNQGQNLFSASMDVNGDYTVFGRKMKTSLGFQFENNTTMPAFFGADPFFGVTNAAAGLGRAAQSQNNFTVAANGRATYLAVPVDNPHTEDLILQIPSYFQSSTIAGANYGTRTELWRTNFYLQQNVEVIRNRLTLVGSLAQYNQFSEVENRAFVPPATVMASIPARVNDLLHRVGFLFRVTKDIGIYGLSSQSITPQNSRLYDGAFAPPQTGTGNELGIKVQTFQDRLSATVGVFKIENRNLAVSTGLTSPITNLGYVNIIGKTIQEGADITLFAKVRPNWQVTVNAYKGTVKDQNGNGNIPNTFKGSWAFYTRYQFQGQTLKKFAIGGGMNRQIGRVVAANTMWVPSPTNPNGVPPPNNGTTGALPYLILKDGTMSQAWISYTPNKNWSIQVSCNNLLDERFAVGFQHTSAIDPAQPRSFQTVATYRF